MKNYFKHFNLIALFISIGLFANAVPDPAVLGAIVSPTPAQWPRMTPEQYESFSFQINNNGSSTSSTLVKIEVTLDNLDFDIPFNSAIHISHPVGTTNFSFSWNSTTKKLTCTLNGTFASFTGNTFVINNLVVQTGSPKPDNLIGGSVQVLLPVGPLNSSTINDITDTHTFTSTRITGTLWDDADGDAIKNTSEREVTSGIIWANLVNTSVDTVQYSVQVDASGNYLFNAIEPSTNFKVILTTTEQLPGTHLTIADQPAGWIPTGVNQDGIHNKDNRTGVLYLHSSTSNYLNQNFGIEQPPVAYDRGASYPASVLDEHYALSPNDALAPQPALLGTDPEDGNLNSFVITSLPANAKLYYNDLQITAADVAAGTGTAIINNYNPDLLAFSSNVFGILFTSFTYVSVDAAGVQSPVATYNINTAGVLAATGLTLKAELSSNVPHLTWTTLTEQNSNYFEIESSIDGINFVKMGTVKASGNSNSLQNYQYNAGAIANNNAVYYRVRLVSTDGTKSMSNMVVLTVKKDINISLFPNPAKQFIMVKGTADNADIILFDINGRILQRQKSTGGSRQLLLSGYASGTYVIQIQENDKIISTKRFIKE